MTILDAKKILALYRSGIDDPRDPQIADALALARRDSELAGWLEQHNRFQTAMREKFSEISAPSSLKEKILAQRKVIHPLPFWRNPVSLRLAASIVLLIGVGFGALFFWNNSRTPDKFADFESRMVGSALREYHMDIVTNDLKQIRQHLASLGAPADFSLPTGLAQLQLTGGGVLRWRNNPVSMVCFNRGDDQMLFLFVMNREAVKDPPDAVALEQIHRLAAASWSEGDKTFLLAGPEEANFLRKYL